MKEAERGKRRREKLPTARPVPVASRPSLPLRRCPLACWLLYFALLLSVFSSSSH